jgi:uncharacterized membrane protein YvbJ
MSVQKPSPRTALLSDDGELINAIFCSRCGELTSLDDHRCDACGELFPEPPSIIRMRLERLRQPDKQSKREFRLAPDRSDVRVLILLGAIILCIALFVYGAILVGTSTALPTSCC